MAKKKNPWLKFYPADWRADAGLKTCSLAARGLWIEMLGYMHESEDRGFLYLAGNPMTIRELATLVGRPLNEVKAAFNELSAKKIFSFSARKGVQIPFSRRMVADEKKARIAQKNGISGGNPSLSNKTINRPSVNQNPTKGVNQEIKNPVNQNRTKGVKPHEESEARSQKPESKKNISSSSLPSSATEPDDDDDDGWVTDPVANQVCQILNVDPTTHPAWATVDAHVNRWRRSGFEDEDIIGGARITRANFDRKGEGPPGSPKYLDQPIARARRDRTSPVQSAAGAPAPLTGFAPKQPWQELRSELLQQNTPEAEHKSDALRAAYGDGGHEAANALAAELQQQEAV